MLLALATALTVSACGSDDAARAARTAAATFSQAVADQDGSRACALLSPQTAKTLADTESQPCAAAVLAEDLPTPATIQKVDREGRSAFVVTDDDTIFLSQFPDGWKIIGAGCTEQGSAPYDCTVSGG